MLLYLLVFLVILLIFILFRYLPTRIFFIFVTLLAVLGGTPLHIRPSIGMLLHGAVIYSQSPVAKSFTAPSFTAFDVRHATRTEFGVCVSDAL